MRRINSAFVVYYCASQIYWSSWEIEKYNIMRDVADIIYLNFQKGFNEIPQQGFL